MEDGNSFDKAAGRLDTALRSIEDAVASERKQQLNNDSLVERIQALESNLESERETNEKLATTNQDVAGRLDKVIESIDDILQSD